MMWEDRTAQEVFKNIPEGKGASGKSRTRCYNKSPSINTTISWDSNIIQYIWLHVSAYLKPSLGQ